MTDHEFLELNAEVERLQALFEESLNDRNMGVDDRRAIADVYRRKYRELNEAALSRIEIYKDTD